MNSAAGGSPFNPAGGGTFTESGAWVQISRLGMPLTNEVITPIGNKDFWNSLTPYQDMANLATFGNNFYNPELALYMDDSQFGGAVPAFAQTAAYTWLLNNAHTYGFILSYPKSNTYYIYEPWHWRFVGVDLAKDLHKAKKNFYDLDQREIDKYLITLFD